MKGNTIGKAKERAVELREGLQQFYGSSRFVQHPLNPQVVMSEGVIYLMEHAEAYWLGDLIASYFGTQLMKHAIERDERLATLQFWDLTVQNQLGLIEARADKEVTPFISQAVGYTDFPLERIAIWAGWNGRGWTLYLPSEH